MSPSGCWHADYTDFLLNRTLDTRLLLWLNIFLVFPFQTFLNTSKQGRVGGEIWNAEKNTWKFNILQKIFLSGSEMPCFSLIAAQKWLSCHCLISVNMEDIIPPKYFFFSTGWCCLGRGQARCTPLFNQCSRLFATWCSWRKVGDIFPEKVASPEPNKRHHRWWFLTTHIKACLRSAAMPLQSSETSLLWNRDHSRHAKYCF